MFNRIFILTILLVSLSASIYVINPSVSKHFPKWTDKLNAIQSHFTVFSFFGVAIGLYEFINKTRAKYNPVLLVNGEEKEVSIKVKSFPHSTLFDFFVFNKGNIPIKNNEMYYKVIFNEIYDPIELSSCIYNDIGNMLIPKKTYHNNPKGISLGGTIPALVLGMRKVR